MIKVRISCPISWHEQCKWIEDHCKDYKDATEWAAWQIGIDDIYYYLRDKDATLFFLRWN
jgi:hypothetical protein